MIYDNNRINIILSIVHYILIKVWKTKLQVLSLPTFFLRNNEHCIYNIFNII